MVAEYSVFLTPPLTEQIYLLQYPNRPRGRPYNSHYGATPENMRIKPRSGFMEVDVKLNTQHNFNKYMGLKWGDAAKASRELHNVTGTFGAASGLSGPKPRGLQRAATGALKDAATRELDLENDLQTFANAEADNKVHTTQTLGGQIIRHDAESEAGKPFYFVGAFRGDQLHLTRIDGTVQMRPNFHHLDAEEERARIAASRASAESGPEPVAQAVRQRMVKEEDIHTPEYRLKQVLNAAKDEQWINMEYVDDEHPEAYNAFEEKLKVTDPDNAPLLKSGMDNDAYLDAISAPRHDSPTRRRKRAARRKETIELSEDEDEDMADGDNIVVASAPAVESED